MHCNCNASRASSLFFLSFSSSAFDALCKIGRIASGRSLGSISFLGRTTAIRPILHKASKAELEKDKKNKEDARDALQIAKEKVQLRELEMKIIKAEARSFTNSLKSIRPSAVKEKISLFRSNVYSALIIFISSSRNCTFSFAICNAFHYAVLLF